jgi:hypothetical protein
LMGYRSALYFAIGVGLVAVVLDLAFVRVLRDKREGRGDDRDAKVIA